MPSSVTEIGSYAFCGCIRLANIIFSDNIESIGSNAFEECPAIIEFGECGTNLIWILDCKGILKIFGSGEMTEYASYADTSWYNLLDKIRSVVIYDKVTSIGQHAFHNCINLTNILIPDSISSIGKYAFSNCTNLRNIKIPNSVTLLGSYAFYYCKNLTSVSLSDHLQDIKEFTFYNCTSLFNISIPNSVTSIGQFAFTACNSLTNIFIPDSVNNIGNKMFNGNITIFCLEYSYAESWADQNGYSIEIVGPDHSVYDYLITLPSTKTVMVGSITGMDETIFPLFSDTPITWSSSDSTIVNVSENGVLTVLDTGTATITLSVGTTITKCVITAIRAVESFDLIPDIYVIAKKNIKVNINNIMPIDATLQLNWATGDNVYATIDQNGNITGRAVGITSLTVTDNISGLSRTSTIHICYPVSEIDLSLSAEKVLTGKMLYATANVTMNTQNCINQLVTFSSSDESIAVIDQHGLIQTLHPGTVTIIATADNGISASYQLIVDEIHNILTLPAHLSEIGSEAFAGLPAAEAVRIPGSVTSIADDAFSGSSIVILAPDGSYAITWAQDHGFDYLIE